DGFQAYTHELPDKHLATKVSYKSQERAQVIIVCREAAKKYPVLLDYKDDWVTIDFISAYLKRTSAKARKTAGEQGSQSSEADEGMRKLIINSGLKATEGWRLTSEIREGWDAATPKC
ncbi:hypothetical protein JAAARDRAFT_51883, partial [Jaapia argillacea MUCL 33604]